MTLRIKLCFLMDCTASMQPWIKSASQTIYSIIQSTEQRYRESNFTVAFVGYRDYGDYEQFIIRNFTTPIRIEQHIRNIVATGGTDDAEDVAWALDKLRTAIDWYPSDLQIVYHIADSPAHGLNYHNGINDRFPSGDPDGLDPIEPLLWLSDNYMYYTFVRITHHTDKMIDIFQKYYNPEFFNVIDLSVRGPNGLYDTLSEDLDSTITHYISSQDREVD